MSLININESEFSKLKGNVVVMTGGATGIGAVTVKKLHAVGAKVVVGDINEAVMKPMVDSFGPNSGVYFQKTDVSKYEEVLALFKFAYALENRLDVALSNAGLVEIGNTFDPALSEEDIEKEPLTLVMDVNLKGVIFFSRLAAFYLRKSKNENKTSGGSLILVGSVASFGSLSGLFQYSATKYGVMGLFRSLKNFLYQVDGTRVNIICPNMTDTAMVEGVIAMYKANNIAWNKPEDVANAYLYCAAQKIHGQAVYVSGGKQYDIEGPMEKTYKSWLGEDLAKELAMGERALGGGAGWTDRKGGKEEEYEVK